MARRSLALMLVAGVLLSCAGCAIAGGAIVGNALATDSRKGVGQDVDGSVYQSVAVVKDALREMQLPVIWESRRQSGVEICSKYQSHRVWIEVRDLSAETSRIDVRVKCPTGHKEDARRILGVIMKRVSVRRRINPRKTQTAISDPPGVGNSGRTVEPKSSETLGISRKKRWLLR